MFLAFQTRFIPTAVGNAAASTDWVCSRPVHPHGCGERVYQYGSPKSKTGSSPRLWGTPQCGSPATAEARFIPTAVGNACAAPTAPITLSVHPHGCGERAKKPDPVSDALGSSPRLWGTRHQPQTQHGECRFIPTAVGNASASRRNSVCRAVHPHGCGERAVIFHLIAIKYGSSPRLWGTRRFF